MTTPNAQEIISAKTTLQALLTSRLMPSRSIIEFLAESPNDEELAASTYLADYAAQLLIYLTGSVQFLWGLRFCPRRDEVVQHLEAVLLALLALKPEPELAHEHVELLVEFYEELGRTEEAERFQALLTLETSNEVAN
jgi:hypothetical protein